MLAQALPGLFGNTDVLDLDGQLLVELEEYAGEERRVENEQAARRSRSDGAAPTRRRRGPLGLSPR